MQKKPMRGKGQRLLVHILLSALALCAVLCGSFAAFSALLCRVDTPVNLVAPLATAGLCCAVLAAAFFLALLEQSRGLLLGLLVGAVCALALLIWAAGQGGEVTALFLYRALAMLAAGALGGYAGIAAGERRQKKFR